MIFLPNGLELSCSAEAGELSPTLRHAGRQSKPHPLPSPPGQLQRVVGRRLMTQAATRQYWVLTLLVSRERAICLMVQCFTYPARRPGTSDSGEALVILAREESVVATLLESSFP